MNTTAQIFYAAYHRLNHHADGFYGRRWRDLVRGIRRAAVEVEYPYGRNSFDPTTEFRFEDGSALRVSNPGQAAFCGNMDLICPALEA